VRVAYDQHGEKYLACAHDASIGNCVRCDPGPALTACCGLRECACFTPGHTRAVTGWCANAVVCGQQRYPGEDYCSSACRMSHVADLAEFEDEEAA